VGIFIVLFVLAGAVVGYSTQSQNPLAFGAGGSGVVSGPAFPEVIQAATMFATTVASTTAPAGSTSFGGRMIELEADLTIQVDDVKAASDKAAQLALLLNGYVASSSYDDSNSGASIVLQIPSVNFSAAMRSLSRLGVVKAQSISSNDVTEDYVNLQAQLDSYTTENSALLRILNSTKTVQDALNTENAIQNTQAQINGLEDQLRVMQQLVSFATINTQLIKPPENPSLDFGDAFNSALLALYTVTKGMLILGASLIPPAMVGGIIYVPYRLFAHKKPQSVEAK